MAVSVLNDSIILSANKSDLQQILDQIHLDEELLEALRNDES